MQIHTSHAFFKGNKKNTGLQQDNGQKQVTTATSWEGTGAECVYVRDGRGVDVWGTDFGEDGGVLQEQLLHLIS